MKIMKTAKKLSQSLKQDLGNGKYYHKVRQTLYKTEDMGYVIVSEAEGYFKNGVTLDEVYIFQADENGEISDWCELDGSQRPAIPAEELMKKLGYEVT